MPCSRNKNLENGRLHLPKITGNENHTFDDEAFNALYKMHYKRIYALAYRMVRRREDAEDIAQETFLRAFRNFDKLDPRAPIFTWLCKIATNLCIDNARKGKNVQLISLDGCYVADILEQKCKLLMKVIDLGQNIDMEETLELIHKAMDALPPHYCQVLVLRGCEELPSKDVAKIMDISVSSVDTILHRARSKVKKIYQELFEKHHVHVFFGVWFIGHLLHRFHLPITRLLK
jgi:RNA polymerase sigma-70 factor (ECF subfamily)